MRSTIILALLLIILDIFSSFVGVLDVQIEGILKGDTQQIHTLLASRLPHLLAIVCTGVGLSVAGLIMQ